MVDCGVEVEPPQALTPAASSSAVRATATRRLARAGVKRSRDADEPRIEHRT
jgi:hypothetical protein